MKNLAKMEVDNLNEESTRAAASWELDGARYHFWFDPRSRKIEDCARGIRSFPTIFKNPLLGVKRGDANYFEPRQLDANARANAEIVAYIFVQIGVRGLVEKAIRERNAKAEAAKAEAAEHARTERIKAAGPKLLELVKRWRDNEGQDGCCLPVVKECHCKKCETKRLLAQIEGVK